MAKASNQDLARHLAQLEEAVAISGQAVHLAAACLEATLADRRIGPVLQSRFIDILAELHARIKLLVGSEVNDPIAADSPLRPEFERRRK